jgi:hypothetical protein
LGTAQRFALWPLMFMGEVAEIARRLPRLIREAQERNDLYGETNLCLAVRTFISLAADEPGRARAELADVMSRWTQEGFHVQHMERLHDEVQIDLYEGNGADAWRRLVEQWPLLARSHLLLVQQARIFMRHLRGRAAVAAAGQGKDRRRYLRAAEEEARALRREGAPWARALAQLLYAGVAAGRGEKERVADLLREAAELCNAAAMRLFAVTARRRLGQWLGGKEGLAVVKSADDWMAGQQVQHPARLAALLVPLAVVS